MYNHKDIEKKWQKYWNDNKSNQIDLDSAKKPFYNLMMFPYPSAEGLHIGGVYTFTGIDTYGRYKRMSGYDIFEPIGLDAFGIHSENYAIKIGEHIRDVSLRTEGHFYEQLKSSGNMFDWDRTVETNKPEYYKWTQWLFIQLFKAGLATRKESIVNWCPSCKTVLSDEQVIDGHCERCDNEVSKKSMNQWFFKITDYAQRLLDNLETIDWMEDVKVGQKNWIGRSEGINIDYEIDGSDKKITCYTTTPVNYGATFIVLAPEHPIIDEIVTEEQREEVVEYAHNSTNLNDVERQAKEKSGVFTGAYAINHLTNERIPIWVADFVLYSVGTGAVQGCPAHDERDFDFASKYNIPIVRVVQSVDGKEDRLVDPKTEAVDQVKRKYGINRPMVNSGELNGMHFDEAMEKTMDIFEEKGWGKRVVNFKLRDWCVSRQRYWGPPIPMIFCQSCADKNEGFHAEEMPGWWPDENLPVTLPEIEKFEDILPDGSGKGPLAKQREFIKATCPHCEGEAERETDVSDPFVDSCWYFLRYPFTDFDNIPFGGDFDNDKSLFEAGIDDVTKEKSISRMKKWGPVTSYIGGKEHTVLHLLYARFITMVMRDLGYLDFEEPFTRFYGHGLITKDGAKMSKSKGNVINPDEYFEKFGADSVRMYLRFMGDFSQGGDWSDAGMKGMYKFVNKVYKLFDELKTTEINKDGGTEIDDAIVHKTIRAVGEDIDKLKFNTAVAKIMELVNWYVDKKDNMNMKQKKATLSKLNLMLAPFMPHFAEEVWNNMGNESSVHDQVWPEFDEAKIVDEIVTIAIQINGKLRDTVEVQADSEQEIVEEAAKASEKIQKYLAGKELRKVIYIKNRIINFIV